MRARARAFHKLNESIFRARTKVVKAAKKENKKTNNNIQASIKHSRALCGRADVVNMYLIITMLSWLKWTRVGEKGTLVILVEQP